MENLVYLYEPEIPKIPEKEKKVIYEIFNSIGKNPKNFYTPNNLGNIRIEDNHVVHLNLFSLGLKELSKEISALENLRVLCAFNNQIVNLPAEIEALKRLEEFYVSGNPLNNESKLLLKRLKDRGVDIGAEILYGFKKR